VARALHAEWPDVTFDFTAKIEHLLRHQAHLPELRALGCVFIVSAAESLSDRVLAILDKGHCGRDIGAALRAARGAGIPLRLTWVPFTPWTTLDDYREMLDFVADEALVDHVDPVQYSLRLLVPPGSLLLAHQEMREHLGPLEPETLSHRWSHPDPRMDALQRAVAGLVTRAAEAGEDPGRTFEGVRALAGAGAPERSRVDPRPAADRPRPPRLTEAWFC
jgi:hypothetical protein